MQQADVVSSNIAKVGHDGVSLFIKFNSGELRLRWSPTRHLHPTREGRVCWPGVSPTREEQVPHEHLTSDPFTVV